VQVPDIPERPGRVLAFPLHRHRGFVSELALAFLRLSGPSRARTFRERRLAPIARDRAALGIPSTVVQAEIARLEVAIAREAIGRLERSA
jgi:hypothetical protein